MGPSPACRISATLYPHCRSWPASNPDLLSSPSPKPRHCTHPEKRGRKRSAGRGVRYLFVEARGLLKKGLVEGRVCERINGQSAVPPSRHQPKRTPLPQKKGGKCIYVYVLCIYRKKDRRTRRSEGLHRTSLIRSWSANPACASSRNG